MKINQKSLVAFAIALVLLWVIFSNKPSGYKHEMSMYTPQSDDEPEDADDDYN